MIEERSWTDVLVDVIIYALTGLLAIICLAPFFNVIAKAFSSARANNMAQVKLWPVGFNVDNFGILMRDHTFTNSFLNSLLRVVLAVPLTLFMSAITAYPMSRDAITMPGRTMYKVVLIFGMLFSGGLIPTYISFKWLGLLNKFAVLILPGAFNVFFTILIINFFRGLPGEMAESAVLDGASHLDILFRIYLPLSIPSMATIAVFSSVGQWNSWFDGVMFLSKPDSWPLQSYLYQRVISLPIPTRSGLGDEGARQALSFSEATSEGMSSAMIVIASVPIMLVYPFMQGYFVKGLTLGAVKG